LVLALFFGWRAAVFGRWAVYFGLGWGPQPPDYGGLVALGIGVSCGLGLWYLSRMEVQLLTAWAVVRSVLIPAAWGVVVGSVIGFDGTLALEWWSDSNLGPPMALVVYGPIGAFLGGVTGMVIGMVSAIGKWRIGNGPERDVRPL
jgi:hypothetical protein